MSIFAKNEPRILTNFGKVLYN